MKRLTEPCESIAHSIFFIHEPELTVVCDNSSVQSSEFKPLLEIGFLYNSVSILRATDPCLESWQWAIASDDSSLDIVWLLEALSRFEDGWEVTPDNWVISKPNSKIELAQMTSIVSEARRPPNPIEPVKQKLMAPLIATAMISFTLGVLFSLFL